MRNHTIKNIGKKISTGVAKTILATAAAAGLGMLASTSSNSAYGALADVTAIQTQFTAGKGVTVNNVSGYGDASTGFLTTNTYTVHYAGGTLTSVTWRVLAGELRVAWELQHSGEVDIYGVRFDHPPGVTGKRWVGEGPYRIWKNRAGGTTFLLSSRIATSSGCCSA